MDESNELIRGLLSAEAYPHSVTDLRVVETHISWVLLTGQFAYKVKKPVVFPFLDFSTLGRRQHFCDEELRLNRRMAPELYLDVVPITGSAESPRIDGSGDVIEYALRMVQFADEARLDRLLEAGGVSHAAMREFAELLAQFHAKVDHSQSSRYGQADAVAKTVTGNAAQVAALIEPSERESLRPVADWLRSEARSRAGTLAGRATAGMTRECHGDLHLSNLVALDDGITAFDCLEFDPALRWIDVIDEVAFLIMDLELRRRADLAWDFANAYLAASGDYAALELLDLYLVHRSLVRAKVAGIARRQSGDSKTDDAHVRLRRHLELAREVIRPRRPVLVLMHGLPASGKSWLAERLVPRLPGIRIRSDLERKRLAGLDATESSGSAPGAGLYSAANTEATYARLEDLAETCLGAGRHVIIDATFGTRALRERFYALGHGAGARTVLIDCQAPAQVLVNRIRARSTKPSVSEADLSILDYALAHHEPLESGEKIRVLAVDTAEATDIDTLTAHILS